MPTVQASRPPRNSFNIRVEVTLLFQNAVNEGSADWYINASGGTELHFKNGEVYQLDETSITRVK
ncbi:hypothetical protein [Pseudomonas sp.]|uniref:hypothetical protein n=1 Tax=Pseudomonas sp. TaxID=306 RepID=UPI0026224D4A|nr:hypothetical protein [Pseudomonas sp.]